jgi:hypothetical protein
VKTPIWSVAVALGVLMSFGSAGAEVIREQSRFERDTHGIVSLRVDNARGLVDVRPSSDGRLKVTALKVVRSPSPSAAREMARGTVVETDESGGVFKIRVRYPSHRVRITFWGNLSTGSLPNAEVRLAIEVPPDLPITLTTASGDLTTAGLSGPQALRSASGDVELNDASGRAEISTASGDVKATGLASASVETASGDVTCDGVSGALAIVTASGDVTIHEASDSLRVRTVAGDVEIDRAPRGLDLQTTSGQLDLGPLSGRVALRSVSGDLDVALAPPLADAEISTQSGTVTLKLDPRIACALSANTTSGEIDFQLPVQARRLSRGNVVATIRGGTTPVRLRTVSGDINVMGGGR